VFCFCFFVLKNYLIFVMGNIDCLQSGLSGCSGSDVIVSDSVYVSDLVLYLDGEYPVFLSEAWDNIGLLVGDDSCLVERVMTCLTVTDLVCAEAVRLGVNLIVSHHPFPFRPLKRITSSTVEGRLLLKLISAGIAVYSPHTAHDSAPDGVNQQLAVILGLVDVVHLNPNGSGRVGNSCGKLTLGDYVKIVNERIGQCCYVGELSNRVERVAIGCGAAEDFVDRAVEFGAGLLLLGEARYHSLLRAEAMGLAVILTGHYASERFAMETLANKIAAKFPTISCTASKEEKDVIKFT
jgi:dinuclear metal center YbgI/SA1388 family protein